MTCKTPLEKLQLVAQQSVSTISKAVVQGLLTYLAAGYNRFKLVLYPSDELLIIGV